MSYKITHVLGFITIFFSTLSIISCCLCLILLNQKEQEIRCELKSDLTEFELVSQRAHLKLDNVKTQFLNAFSSQCSGNPVCPPGAPGPMGDPGQPGAFGIPGTPGETGFTGTLPRSPYSWDVPNRKCFICPRGRPGADGNAGVAGQQGAPGEKGSIGVAGNSGLPGPRGLAGSFGEYGTLGKVGTRGQPGRPATIGGKGKPGVDAEAGKRGPSGIPGQDGTDGKDGTPGSNGEAGTIGAAGKQGSQGLPGYLGAQGAAGSDGGYCRICPFGVQSNQKSAAKREQAILIGASSGTSTDFPIPHQIDLEKFTHLPLNIGPRDDTDANESQLHRKSSSARRPPFIAFIRGN